MKAYLIEDEQPAIDNFSFLITQIKNKIELVGYSQTIDEFIAYLKLGNSIDVLFLDINLKKENGFDVFNKLDEISFSIIFVTAYSEYAIKAFKYKALDYLLKPVQVYDLDLALDKIDLCKSSKSDTIEYYKKVQNELTKLSNSSTNNKIIINTHSTKELISYNEIVYLKAEGAYSRIFLSNKKEIVVSKNLSSFEEELPNDSFFRIHRSYIVNNYFVINQTKINDSITLLSGEILPISKRKNNIVLSFYKLFGKTK